ncbi:MAG: hypothetical protein R8J94_01375 [Acidimicrobiia bacterium]|nr:hypothetical protein [Acidimicrobiia bacterium]
MTHDDDIPELLNRLEDRLDSPSADAIRTEASRRRAVRMRMANTAGVLALIVAIVGSALWFTRDTPATTATVAEDAVELVDVQPVAADSAPIVLDGAELLRELGPLTIVTDFSQEEQPPFYPRTEAASASFLLQRRNSVSEVTDNGMLLFDGCDTDAYWIEWAESGFQVGERAIVPSYDVPEGETACGQTNEHSGFNSRIQSGQFVSVSYDPSKNTFLLRSDGHSSGIIVRSPPNRAWTMVLAGPPRTTSIASTATPPTTGPAPLNAQGVVRMDDNCMNFTHLQLRDHGWFIVSDPPLEWQGRPGFDVAVELDASGGFVATDRDGLSATFAFDVDEAQSRSCRRWVNPTPQEALPTIDARSVDDCITGFNATAQVSTIIDGPDENETAWAIFQEAEDWEGNANVCWISISTDMSCRSYAWFKEQGRDPTGFAEDPPLDPDQPCVGNGTQFDEDSAR